MFLVFAAAVFAIFLIVKHRWDQSNSKDLGTMSQQWLMEYNSQHP